MKQPKIDLDYYKAEIYRAYCVLGIKAEPDNNGYIRNLYRLHEINLNEREQLLAYNKKMEKQVAKELWG